jgi:hypothetical protein
MKIFNVGQTLNYEEVKYIKALEELWDFLSNAVEDSAVNTGNLPDDYLPLVKRMEKLARMHNRMSI